MEGGQMAWLLALGTEA